MKMSVRTVAAKLYFRPAVIICHDLRLRCKTVSVLGISVLKKSPEHQNIPLLCLLFYHRDVIFFFAAQDNIWTMNRITGTHFNTIEQKLKEIQFTSNIAEIILNLFNAIIQPEGSAVGIHI